MVHAYVFVDFPDEHPDGRIYGLGGVPPLTFAEAHARRECDFTTS